jgi:mannose-1-phosphate guanylyltransferase
MAGGGGTRLWPLSRQKHPKQVLNLLGDRSMFQLAVDRLLPLLPPERVLVVTAADQVAALAEQVPELPRENFIVEPLGRGTAPCIGLAALHLRARDPDAVMAVLTADHYIRHTEAFRVVLSVARKVAEQGYLVTLGIEPTFPATGYGYIGQGTGLGKMDGFPVFHVERFTEKPDSETALRFLGAGTYAWNSGMFIWQVERLLAEIRQWIPELHETLIALEAVLGTPAYGKTLADLWPALHKETIDYGIMEKAERVAVIPVDLGWSDVGAWSSVMELREPDGEGNVISGDVLRIATTNTMVLSQAERLVAIIGVQDLIVVDTPDALLVTSRSQSERVRELVEQLRREGRTEQL